MDFPCQNWADYWIFFKKWADYVWVILIMDQRIMFL